MSECMAPEWYWMGYLSAIPMESSEGEGRSRVLFIVGPWPWRQQENMSKLRMDKLYLGWRDKCRRAWSIMISVRAFCGGQGPQSGIGLPQKEEWKSHFPSTPPQDSSAELYRNQPDINPFLAIPGISPYWNHLNSTNSDLWQAPEGAFGYGRRTYSWFPSRWKGPVS